MKSSRKESASAGAAPRRGRPKAIPESPPRTRSSPARSPARTRRASPPTATVAAAPRSLSRRSPARSPARNASAKFPARKSPARVAESARPARRTALRNEDPVELKSKLSEPTVRIARPRRSEYTIKDLSVGLNQVEMSIGDRVNGLDKKERVPRATVAPQMIRRTSARLRDSASQPSGSSRLSESASRSLDVPLGEDSHDSDEELVREKSTSAVRKLATPMRGLSTGQSGTHQSEFGGRFGSALLVVLLPAWIFAVLTLCARSCAFRLPRLETPSLSALFSLKASVLVAGQVTLLTLLSLVNVLGRRVNRMDQSGNLQFFNGFFVSVVSLASLFAVDFFNILSVKTVLEEYLRLAVLFYILATLLAVALYVKSRKLPDDQLNPYGNSGSLLYDFWVGRELFPRLGRIDVKILLHRICNVNGLILSVLFFTRGLKLPQSEAIDSDFKDILYQLQYNPTLLVISSMQLTYFLNLILDDHKITTTFSWQSEGVGYMQTVSSALYPFYFLTISKFVLDNKVSLSNNLLIAAGVVYLLGFFVYLISNNIKHEFRKNPIQPKLSHLEVMPTFLGKRLIISGAWGTIRHPNYLGDIILHLALALPGTVPGINAAVVPVVTTVLVLCHRAARDSARCKRRYGAAWQRYSLKVPSAILPKIY